MTETSLLPMAAEAADMTFQDVVSRVIEAALLAAVIGYIADEDPGDTSARV